MIGNFTLATKGAGMLGPHKDRSNITRFMILEKWTLLLFKVFDLMPKTTQAAARTDIACASCEKCSYHLDLNH
jgi:hypothetical protein